MWTFITASQAGNLANTSSDMLWSETGVVLVDLCAKVVV